MRSVWTVVSRQALGLEGCRTAACFALCCVDLTFLLPRPRATARCRTENQKNLNRCSKIVTFKGVPHGMQ